MMEAIRFSILLSLLFFAGYASHTAEESVKERRSTNMRVVLPEDGIAGEHYQFIRRALDLHLSGTKTNEPAQSASLIVKDGEVVGEGSDKSIYFTDPSAHAAMTAVREACRNIGMTSLKGCTLYATAELCPMCVSLLYVANIDKIIYCIPSEDGPSTETLTSEIIRRNAAENPIPMIFFPYQMLDSAIRSATDDVIY